MDPTAAIDMPVDYPADAPSPPRVLAIGRVVAEFSAGPALDSANSSVVFRRIDEAIDARHRLLSLTAGGLRLSAASVAAFNCYLRSVVVCDGVRMPFDRVDAAHGGTAYSWFNFLRYLGARFDS
jgi:hypothetical protein